MFDVYLTISDYNELVMQEVGVAELKARLSHYLRLVENGEEVLVKARERPVARLVSCVPNANVDIGIPRRVSREQAAKIIASIPRPKLSRRAVEDAMRWMREDRSKN
jgi:prevent-host-death family protein